MEILEKLAMVMVRMVGIMVSSEGGRNLMVTRNDNEKSGDHKFE